MWFSGFLFLILSVIVDVYKLASYFFPENTSVLFQFDTLQPREFDMWLQFVLNCVSYQPCKWPGPQSKHVIFIPSATELASFPRGIFVETGCSLIAILSEDPIHYCCLLGPQISSREQVNIFGYFQGQI